MTIIGCRGATVRRLWTGEPGLEKSPINGLSGVLPPYLGRAFGVTVAL